jgi:hypothetical protein
MVGYRDKIDEYVSFSFLLGIINPDFIPESLIQSGK